MLHATVRAHLKTFLAQVEQRGDGAGLPRFVVSEFERYLGCGMLADGFARVRCASCGDEMLVALSCWSAGRDAPGSPSRPHRSTDRGGAQCRAGPGPTLAGRRTLGAAQPAVSGPDGFVRMP
jgi:hypothetical protein